MNWRLADVLAAAGRHAEADEALEAARSGFEALLERHLLAFADHGAEFYSGSGNNARRSLSWRRSILQIAPTLRAFEHAYEMAINAADIAAAIDIRAPRQRALGRHDSVSPVVARGRIGGAPL